LISDTSLVRRTRIRMCNCMLYSVLQSPFSNLAMKINIHDNISLHPRFTLSPGGSTGNRDTYALDSSPRNLASFLLLAFALILSICPSAHSYSLCCTYFLFILDSSIFLPHQHPNFNTEEHVHSSHSRFAIISIPLPNLRSSFSGLSVSSDSHER
jgi:hypothetical protein